MGNGFYDFPMIDKFNIHFKHHIRLNDLVCDEISESLTPGCDKAPRPELRGVHRMLITLA